MSESPSKSNVRPFQPDDIEKVEHTRYGHSRRSRSRTLKIMMLSVALSIAVLIIIVETIYTSFRISVLSEANRVLKFSLIEANNKLDAVMPELDKLQSDIKVMVTDKFPNLMGMETNRVIDVSKEFVKSILFTTITEGDRELYKFLLVMENNTTQEVKPSFRVLLFDEYGVHIATNERHDDRALKPGESRDYAAELEFLLDAKPGHFYVDDLNTHARTGS